MKKLLSLARQYLDHNLLSLGSLCLIFFLSFDSLSLFAFTFIFVLICKYYEDAVEFGKTVSAGWGIE